MPNLGVHLPSQSLCDFSLCTYRISLVHTGSLVYHRKNSLMISIMIYAYILHITHTASMYPSFDHIRAQSIASIYVHVLSIRALHY
eukprot:c14102_g1_i1 orf=3-257(-)